MDRFVHRMLLAVAAVMLAAAAPLHAQVDLSRLLPATTLFPQQESLLESEALFALGLDSSGESSSQARPEPRHPGIKQLPRELLADLRHLPSRDTWFWAGMGTGFALLAHPFDDNLNANLVGNDLAEKAFRPGAVLGQLPVLLGAATSIYVAGRVRDEPRVSRVGMDLIRSLILSQGLTIALKYSVRRERPDGSARNSFPSGHAADTFAFATALERNFGWRYAVPAYTFASYVAVSRLPANRHWLSDAMFGAALGIIAGHTVTARQDKQPPVTVAYVPGGVAVMVVRRPQ